MSVRMTAKAHMEGRLMRKVTILRSAGRFKGESFVANDKFRPKWDGRNVPQYSKKV